MTLEYVVGVVGSDPLPSVQASAIGVAATTKGFVVATATVHNGCERVVLGSFDVDANALSFSSIEDIEHFEVVPIGRIGNTLRNPLHRPNLAAISRPMKMKTGLRLDCYRMKPLRRKAPVVSVLTITRSTAGVPV